MIMFIKTCSLSIPFQTSHCYLNHLSSCNCCEYIVVDEKNSKLLTGECAQSLSQSVRVIADRVSKLHNGSITIGDLNLLVSKEQAFSQLSELVSQQKEFTSTVVTRVIQLRQKEVKAFQSQAKEMATFATLCQHLPNGKIYIELFS